MAGAIQDNDRGVIIGRRSFGKGLVQKETSFDDVLGLTDALEALFQRITAKGARAEVIFVDVKEYGAAYSMKGRYTITGDAVEVHAFVLRFEQPFAWPEFAEAIDVLLATCGDRILRVKGLIAVQGENGPRVLQCVQHMRYPEAMLPAWPDGDQQSRLVFIVRALAQDIVRQAFAMFCGVSAQPCSR